MPAGAGGNFWDSTGYQPEWGNSGQPAGPPIRSRGGASGPEMGGGEMPADTNQAGSQYDPFQYTRGSLLTPWEGKFDGSRFGGGGGGPAPYKAFEYADFNYKPNLPGAFGETYKDPGDFNYGEYTSRGGYKQPTEKDLKADPSYQLRQDKAMKVLQASKAAQGILKTGGTLKGFQKNASDLASAEYGAVDARKRRDYEGDVTEDRFRYGTNRANATENFDRNVSNQRTGYQVRQAAWKDNAAVGLEGSRLGYDVAQGTYDRNYGKARQGYDDLQAYENAVASAAASGSARDYNRALDEYTMARDEFWQNQDRQYNILDREDAKGRDAAYRYADSQTRYGDTSADVAIGRGDAAASGRIGSGNASASAWGNVGQNAADLAMYAYSQRQPSAGAPRSSAPRLSGTAPGYPRGTTGTGSSAGVTPFRRPPTAAFPPPYSYGDESNR